METQSSNLNIDSVKSRMLTLRGQLVLLDRDVANLYEVETREINQAVRNNPDKFPVGYVFSLNETEFSAWKSKILMSNITKSEKNGISKGLRHTPVAFTERGLYMLATILKGARAVKTTLAIIETYAQVRELVRTMEAIQSVKDGGKQQKSLLQKTGEVLAGIVGENLATESEEIDIELNFAIVKIHRKITKRVPTIARTAPASSTMP